jgi:mannose-1-phosphate guanylyltransferase
VKQFKEKPVLSHVVSMGIYCMEPEVLRFIPSGVPFGFDDLILCLLNRDIPVSTFRHSGMWLDVGRVEDFQKAQELGWDDQPPAFEEIAA